ncbi:MAG: SMC-Scp complex subunit ScpB [Patescibacteria group bacterium]|nr:SMC-Scp complex subunit ScpB [bacterium]MDZ4227093.1 SMC-Scp complex subunit ScpB [Patescibacteria group bacterium]
MTDDLSTRAEAFLFMEGGSLTLRRLGGLLKADEGALRLALQTLSEKLRGRGLSLIVTDTQVSLSVSADASRTVEDAYKQELGRDIGDAGLEVLAIVLYRGASTRAQIDYIRGVNTSSTIRNLLGRGLLERAGNPNDAREYLYRPTPELLAYFGIERAEMLPDYTAIAGELSAFENNRVEEDKENHADEH